MHEYLFDVKLFASVRIKAETVAEARAKIEELDCASVSFNDCITGEASTDGTGYLIEVDGVLTDECD